MYSAKQAKLLQLFKQNKLKRLNILHGSVRSGKTWISLVLWAFWVLTQPIDGTYIMCAKTLTSLKRNCLDLLQVLIGTKNFSYNLTSKQAQLFGRTVYLEGVNDSRAEDKIRGMTLNGAYCDELTLFTEDFFAMLLSRLSARGAKLFGTTNPDNPHHWFKTEYLNRSEDLDILVVAFYIDDNPYLDTEYVTQLKREYTGVYYQRFILGLWVAAEGAIYELFADNPNQFIIEDLPRRKPTSSNALGTPDFIYGVIGVDFGGNGSANAFVCNGVLPKYAGIVTVKEYYQKGITSPAKLEQEFVAFVKSCKSMGLKIYEVYCDSAEQTLIEGLRVASRKARLNVEIKNARKSAITERIRFYNMLMGLGQYKVLSSCPKVIEALSSAVWDAKKTTKDVRLDDGKYNIDSLDALEYSTESLMAEMIAMR